MKTIIRKKIVLVIIFVLVDLSIVKAQYLRNVNFETADNNTSDGSYPRIHANVDSRKVKIANSKGKCKKTVNEPGVQHWQADEVFGYIDDNGTIKTGGDGAKSCLQQAYHSPDWFRPGQTFNYNGSSLETLYGKVNGAKLTGQSGNGYVGMGLCELIQQKLNTKLTKGQTYYLDFYVFPISTGHETGGGYQNGTSSGFNGGYVTRQNTKISFYLTREDVKYTKSSLDNTVGSSLVHENYCMKKNFLGNWSDRIDISQNVPLINNSNYNYDSWNKVTVSFTAPKSNFNWLVVEMDHPGATSSGYVYLDGIRILDEAPECEETCEDNETYNHPFIPSSTIRSDFIRAHQAAKVATGKSVYFQAGNTIYLEPNFHVEPYADFEAVIAPCGGIGGNGMQIVNMPNIFTPNGDGVNDELCIEITNAETYDLRVYNRWGKLILDKSGTFTNDVACVWDGQGVSDSDYFAVILIKNGCTEMEYKFWFNINRDYHGRPAGDGLQEESDYEVAKIKTAALKVYPNPSASGLFNISTEGFTGQKHVDVMDIYGKVVRTFDFDGIQSEINLTELSKGLYMLRINDGENVKISRLVYQ